MKDQAQIVALIMVMEGLDGCEDVTVRTLSKRLNLGDEAVRRRLRKAEYAGYVEDVSDKKGERHRGHWKLTGEKPTARGDLLPSVEELQRAFANKSARRADAGVEAGASGNSLSAISFRKRAGTCG